MGSARLGYLSVSGLGLSLSLRLEHGLLVRLHLLVARGRVGARPARAGQAARALLQLIRLLKRDRLGLLRILLLHRRRQSRELMRARRARVGRVGERRARERVLPHHALRRHPMLLLMALLCRAGELSSRSGRARAAAEDPDGLGRRVLAERVRAHGLALPALRRGRRVGEVLAPEEEPEIRVAGALGDVPPPADAAEAQLGRVGQEARVARHRWEVPMYDRVAFERELDGLGLGRILLRRRAVDRVRGHRHALGRRGGEIPQAIGGW